MKRNTIKWRIFKYNLILIIVLIAFTTVIFNIAVRTYIDNDIIGQLNKIATHAVDTALQRKGPDFSKGHGKIPPPPHEDQDNLTQSDSNYFEYYLRIERSLREPLSVLNADFVLLDSSRNIINPFEEDYFNTSSDMTSKIKEELSGSKDLNTEKHLNFSISGTEYVAVIKPVYQKNTFGLGWIVIYSSVQKVNQLQWGINTILLLILVLSALVTVIFSSLAARKISAPFASLNRHISTLAERNFGAKIDLPVYAELQEVVNNINIMSEKLESYDKAQKTFLQNASHEFRTPLMSIQSYAEGIKYEVVDNDTAVNVIIDETKRMTHLVEDLLYLSRLDTIEENYRFVKLDYNSLIASCVERMNGIALKNEISINANKLPDNTMIHADDEKLTRAIINIVGNCMRYAKTKVELGSSIVSGNSIRLTISDDGPGFDPNELPNIFERFYKGKKGNFGLGLAISKNVIERHNGTIRAENTESGALFTIELPLAQD